MMNLRRYQRIANLTLNLYFGVRYLVCSWCTTRCPRRVAGLGGNDIVPFPDLLQVVTLVQLPLSSLAYSTLQLDKAFVRVLSFSFFDDIAIIFCLRFCLRACFSQITTRYSQDMMLACTPHCAFALQYMPMQRDAKNVALFFGRHLRATQRSNHSFQRRKSKTPALAMSNAKDFLIIVACCFSPIIVAIAEFYCSNIMAWISNRLVSEEDKKTAKLFQYQEICRGEGVIRRDEGVIPKVGSIAVILSDIVNCISNRLMSEEDQKSAKLFQYQEIRRGEGVIPKVGSIAAIFFEARLYSPRGSMLASALPESPPFAFEVGDSTIWRGLDAAVRKMREGAIADLMLTPEGGYTRCCMQPEPSDPRLVKNVLEKADRFKLYPDDAFEPTMHVRVRLEAVLALPPAMLAEGGVVSPHRLRKMLQKTSDGQYVINYGDAE